MIERIGRRTRKASVVEEHHHLRLAEKSRTGSLRYYPERTTGKGNDRLAVWFDLAAVKFGSSGRTRTYNPPVNRSVVYVSNQVLPIRAKLSKPLWKPILG